MFTELTASQDDQSGLKTPLVLKQVIHITGHIPDSLTHCSFDEPWSMPDHMSLFLDCPNEGQSSVKNTVENKNADSQYLPFLWLNILRQDFSTFILLRSTSLKSKCDLPFSILHTNWLLLLPWIVLTYLVNVFPISSYWVHSPVSLPSTWKV